MNWSGMQRSRIRLATRTVATAALLISSLAGLAIGTQTVRAANPLEFAGAAVTPADAATFMAVSLDPTEAQYVQAMELVARITGTDVADLDDELEMDSILPEELGDLPQLENGQAAFVALQQDLGALMAGGMFGPSTIDDLLEGAPLPDSSEMIESVSPQDLQGFSVVLTADNISDVGEELLAELREEAQVHGDVLVTAETAAGSVISSLELSEHDQSDEIGFRTLAQLDGAVVLGFSEEGVLPFVTTSEGDTPALADDAGYQAAMAALPSDVLFGGYSPGVTEAQIADMQEVVDQTEYPIALDLIVEPTGPTGFAVVAAEEGFRIESATIAPAGGIASPVPATSGELTLAEHVQSDTMIFANGFDLGSTQILRAAEQMILVIIQGTMGDDDTPLPVFTESAIAQQYAGLEMLLGFNAQTDLIRQLTGEYGFVVSSIDLFDPTGFGVLLVSEVDNAETVDAALRRLALLSQAIGEDVPPIVNITIGEFDVSQMTFDVDGTEMPVQFGVIGDQMVVGIGSALTNFVLGGAETLSTNPVFTEAMSLLPAAETGMYFVNVPEIVELATLAMGLFIGSFETSFETEVAVGSDSSDDAVVDASERCGEFASQDEAQAAYDSDPVANFDLDFDFDGDACDDYFPDDFDDSGSGDFEIGSFALDAQITIGGLGMVTYNDGDIHRMSGILVVPSTE